MGDNFNPLIPGVGANLINNAMKDKPGDTSTPPSYASNPTSLFEPYNRYIPQAMNSNQPITDPSAILQGYQQHLPDFRLAAQGPPGAPPISESLGSRQIKKGK